MMNKNLAKFAGLETSDQGTKLRRARLASCLGFLLLAFGADVPARAQCDAYVAQNASNSAWVINTKTDTPAAVIPVQFSPLGVAIAPNGAFAYVTNTGAVCSLCPLSQPPSVSVIDTATYAVVATIPVGQYPAGIAVTPNGAFVYVANFNSNSVSVIDTASNTVTATVPAGTNPLGVAITPNGAFAYVTDYTSRDVKVIETSTNTVVATLGVFLPGASLGFGAAPWNVAITPSGAFAYVTIPSMNQVLVIDTATNTRVGNVAVGCGPTAVAITPNGAFVYVANSCDSTVSVINAATSSVVSTVAVGGDPENMAITPDGAFAYTSNVLTNNLSVIDTSTNRVVDTVQAAGTQPQGIAIKLRPDAVGTSCR